MRIGLGQIDMGFEEKKKAMRLCHDMIKEASAKNVDLLLFPEMTLTGFTMKTKELGEPLAHSPSLDFFREEAKNYKIALGFGLPVLKGELAENHCILVDEAGEVLADYAKIHPFSFGTESKYYIGGNELQSCKIKGVPVAPFICYDLRFPEVFQLASENCLILTVIANWPASRKEHWIALLKARAIENQAFVIGVNRTGKGGGLDYCGDSMIFSPLGEIIAQSGSVPGLTVGDIIVAEAEKYRREFPLKSDRKPTLYSALWQKGGKL